MIDGPDRLDGAGGRADVTDLLQAWSGGDAAALDQMLPLVHERLRRLASGFLRNERRDHTLQTAGLVNEAYLRLVRLERVSWTDRAHFYALCARLMRRVLVDHGRRTRAEKRGGEAEVVDLEMAEGFSVGRSEDLLALDLALHDLARHDAELARIVEMRYFGGLSRDEIAAVLGIGSATVTRRWRLARAWLFQQLGAPGGDADPDESPDAEPGLAAGGA